MTDFEWTYDVEAPTLGNDKSWTIDVSTLTASEKLGVQEILIDKGWKWGYWYEGVNVRLTGISQKYYYLNVGHKGRMNIKWNPNLLTKPQYSNFIHVCGRHLLNVLGNESK